MSSASLVNVPIEVWMGNSPSSRPKDPSDGKKSVDGDGKRASSPPPSNRKSVKPPSLWFCKNALCTYHDHLTPFVAKDARGPSPGVLHCPLCKTATLVPANEINLPPWYDHDTIRRKSNFPDPIFPAQDGYCTD